MSKCCAYHWSRSPAGIFFGYQRSTKPGSDQLAVPTRIFPVLILPEDLLVTHQTKSHAAANANGIAVSLRCGRTNAFSICTTSISKLFSKCGVEQPGSSSGS